MPFAGDIYTTAQMRKFRHDLIKTIRIHDHKGVLQQLENIVDALSQSANQTHKPEALIKQHKIAEKTTSSRHEIGKTGLAPSEAGRPWRILNLNHGIMTHKWILLLTHKIKNV